MDPGRGVTVDLCTGRGLKGGFGGSEVCGQTRVVVLCWYDEGIIEVGVQSRLSKTDL